MLIEHVSIQSYCFELDHCFFRHSSACVFSQNIHNHSKLLSWLWFVCSQNTCEKWCTCDTCRNSSRRQWGWRKAQIPTRRTQRASDWPHELQRLQHCFPETPLAPVKTKLILVEMQLYKKKSIPLSLFLLSQEEVLARRQAADSEAHSTRVKSPSRDADQHWQSTAQQWRPDPDVRPVKCKTRNIK